MLLTGQSEASGCNFQEPFLGLGARTQQSTCPNFISLLCVVQKGEA